MDKSKGFTLLELLVALLILSLLASTAAPNLNDLLVKGRVDNEISQIHKLLSLARNSSINMESPVVVCPFSEGRCVNDWSNEVIAFIDLNGNRSFDYSEDSSVSERIIFTKRKIEQGDFLSYSRVKIVYQITGQTGGYNGTFRYCPSGHPDKKRGLKVSLRGRVYTSSDIDNDGKDEFRNGSEIPNC